MHGDQAGGAGIQVAVGVGAAVEIVSWPLLPG